MRKNYTAKYKAEAVLAVLREAESLNETTERLEVHPNMLGRWKNEAVRNLFTVFENDKGGRQREHEAEIQELYAQIGELTAKLGWLKKTIRHRRSAVMRGCKWWTRPILIFLSASRVICCR